MNTTGRTPPAAPVRATGGAGLVGMVERLWCLFGNHVPDDTVVWHGGYGFAHCRRCRQPIVRSLLSNWMVPGPHLRIVWDKASNRPAPPAGLPQPTIEVASPVVQVGPTADRTPDTSIIVTSQVPGKEAAATSPVVVEATPELPRAATASNAKETRKPLLAVAEPIDLLGPHFMGDQGAPPGPSEGLSVFEFDDMTDGEGAIPAVSAAAGGTR